MNTASSSEELNALQLGIWKGLNQDSDGFTAVAAA